MKHRFAFLFCIYSLRYLVRWDASADKVIEIYDTTADKQLATPLGEKDVDQAEIESMLNWARAFLQDYSSRVTSDRLSI